MAAARGCLLFGSLDELAVDEDRAGADQGDQMRAGAGPLDDLPGVTSPDTDQTVPCQRAGGYLR
jgi:hypothetical protein